jgi:hypothetical protein
MHGAYSVKIMLWHLFYMHVMV